MDNLILKTLSEAGNSYSPGYHFETRHNPLSSKVKYGMYISILFCEAGNCHNPGYHFEKQAGFTF